MSDARSFLTARWVHLAMLNYEVEPSILHGLVPAGTELDAFEGRTFVSMVGFQFLDTRLLGVPVPFHRNFEEVNLRFYVRRNTPEGPRRGVVFVKEIVPRFAIAWLAREVYNENYVALPMAHEDEVGSRPEPRVAYRWNYEGQEQQLAVRVSGEPYLPEESGEESFIAEHYWGYARQRAGTTLEYRVEHPRWRVWRADEAELRCDAAGLYGEAFAPFLAGEPSSAFLAEGSAVTVRQGRAIARPSNAAGRP